jgi:hypothetical protein
MAEKKNTIVEIGLNFLRDVLNNSTKPNAAPPESAKQLKLEEIPLDNLKREKIVLEQEEKKTLSRLRELEARKRQLFSEGVQSNASDREQLVFARKIKELDVEASSLDGLLQVFAKQMRVINGLVQVKERSLVLSSTSSTILAQLSMDDVLRYVNLSSADGEFQMTKFDDLLRTMEMNASLAPEYHEESDVMDIMKAMQRAREAGENTDQKIDEELRGLQEKKQSKMEASDLG